MLSICIPFYKGLDFLIEAVESVKGQKSPDWDLLIADDGGPNLEVDAWVRTLSDSRIRYFRHEKNLGMGANWNFCFQNSRGSWVSLLHADDKLHPQYVEHMMFLQAKFPQAAAVFSGAQVINAAGRNTTTAADFFKKFITPKSVGGFVELQGDSGLSALLQGQFLFCPTLCYQKEKIGDLVFDSTLKQALDLKFFGNILLKGESIVGTPTKKYYFYRRHAVNASVLNVQNLSRFKEENGVILALGREAQNRNWFQAYKMSLKRKSLKLHVIWLALNDALFFKKKAFLEKLKFLRTLLDGT